MSDFRFGARASLQTLKEQRNKICNDSQGAGYDIYMGIHKPTNERVLHFDKYIVVWLDEHWNYFCKLCEDNKDSLTGYERDELTRRFAKQYSNMLVSVEQLHSFSGGELTSKCLKIKKQYLEELIDIARKNEQNIEKLKLEARKHTDWFEQELKKIENTMEE